MVRQTFSALETMEEGQLLSDIEESLYISNRLIDNEMINFVIPLFGRTTMLYRYMDTFKNSFLEHNENVSVLVMMYSEEGKSNTSALINKAIEELSGEYPDKAIRLIQRNGSFNRGVALEEASTYFQPNNLLVFLDVDCLVSKDILQQIRLNTKQGKQVYFSIMFSEYNPSFVRVNGTRSFVNENGFWRFPSFGQVSIYKSDFDVVGGYNLEFRGWGKEDIDFIQRVLDTNLTVFRVPDMGLFHKFHPIFCDPDLPSDNYAMCRGTIGSTIGSSWILSEWICNNSLIMKRNMI